MDEWANKLYVVVRSDMTPGYQAVQAGHAVAEFCFRFPLAARLWRTSSNTLIFLAARDLMELRSLVLSARRAGIRNAPFLEPDLRNTMTAAAFEPSIGSADLLADLPLALKRNALGRFLHRSEVGR